MKARTAFTLMEIMIGIVVMVIVSLVALLSPNIARQTAKHEAEKLQAYIYRQMQKADMMHKNFYLEFDPGFVRVNWYNMDTADDSFKASSGCSYSNKFAIPNEARYNPYKRRFIGGGGTITIKDYAGNLYYVIIASTEGRVRISDTPPPP